METSIDVIIPARNASRFIGNALDSLKKQTLKDWRVFVVDDGSTDDTRARVLAETDTRIHCLHTPGVGAPLARNEGLQHADRPYALFLDADDMLEPTALERLCAKLVADPLSVLAYGAEMLVAADGTPFREGMQRDKQGYPSGQVLEIILTRCFIPTPGAALIRAQRVRDVGGFTPGLPAAQDWELWCRLALNGDFAYVGGDPVIRYRMHGDAMTANLTPDRYEPANEAVFNHPEIRRRLPNDRIIQLRRQREAQDYYNSAKEAFRRDDWRAARTWAWESLRRNPRNTRTWAIAVFAWLSWAPNSVSCRLGKR